MTNEPDDLDEPGDYPPEFMAACEELLEAWTTLSDWVALELLRDGREALAFEPLAATPYAATVVVGSCMEADDQRERQAAARLLGYVRSEDPELQECLAGFFEAECLRDEALDAESPERLECQTVVEQLVYAASRWCEVPEQREAGMAVLREVLEETLEGEYWGSAGYALATLIREGESDAGELLDRFEAFAQGATPAHPARPSLKQELRLVAKLRAGDEHALDSGRLPKQSAAASTDDSGRMPQLERLLEAAREVERLAHAL